MVRGKPETFNRPDYTFKLVGNDGAEPQGNEQVQIGTRQRGAPLDLMVAEAMILANSTWGQWLAELGVPGIYRSQASLAPGVKVRMGTKALPHAGIGVKSYAWSTSPLRRYTDLVNQWQIIACARHGKTAALAAPFKPKDADLFSIISGFDAAYSAYNGYQGAIERFWTLKYLQQHGITELVATRVQGQPGARRRPAAGAAGAGRAGPAARRQGAREAGRDRRDRAGRAAAPWSSGWTPRCRRRGRRRKPRTKRPNTWPPARSRLPWTSTKPKPDRRAIILPREPALPSAPCSSPSASRSPCMRCC